MNEKREGEETRLNETSEGPESKAEEKDVDVSPEAKQKPLAKMNKGELLEKVEELQEEALKNYDLYLRSQAETENIKRRAKKDKADWVKYANESLIKDILPVIDNLEQAITHSHNENPLNALREGVELTLKGLKDNLGKSGLEEVKAKGEPFDPSFHQAVSEQENDDVESGIILHELQKGYTLNQRLIRPAMVVVSKGNPADTTDNKTPEGA